MRRNSNLMLILAVGFFLVGSAIVYVVLRNDDNGNSTSTQYDEPMATVMVAEKDIDTGTIGSDALRDKLVTTKTIPQNQVPAGAVTSAAALNDLVFAVGLAKNQVVTSSVVSPRALADIAIPDGYEAVAIAVDYVAGGAEYVGIGDHINLYVSGDRCTVDAPLKSQQCQENIIHYSELALTNVLVLDVSSQRAASSESPQTTAEGNQVPTISRSTQSGGNLTFLIALKTADVERAVFLSNYARIHISKVNVDAPTSGDSDGFTDNSPVYSQDSDATKIPPSEPDDTTTTTEGEN